MKLTLAILFLLLFNTSLATSPCPSPCTCASEAILCQCRDKGTVVLGSFSQVDYISKIYIHNCSRLVIEPYTFKGLSISEELSIFDIADLVVRPNAFNLMRDYPKQLMIKNSYINNLPPGSFSGLHKMSYLRVQDTQISTIRKAAFQDVEDIEYIYFWQVKIDQIDAESFSRLKNVRNFFIREDVRIGTVGRAIFRGSILRNFFLLDAKVQNMHPLALSGLRGGKQITLSNVTVLKSNYAPGIEPPQNQELERLQIQNCTFDQFAISAFSNVQDVHVEKSTIKDMTPLAAPARNMSRILFLKTRINVFRENSFAGLTRVKDVVFTSCEIDVIRRNSFTNLDISSLVIDGSQISQVHSDAFANSTIRSLQINRTKINVLNKRCFDRLHSSSVKIHRSDFDTVRTEIFRKIVVKNLEIFGCTFRRVQSWIFGSALAGQVTIFRNKFEHPDTQVFEGIGTENLNLTENIFGCVCDRFFAQLVTLESHGFRFSRLTKVSKNMCFERNSKNDRQYTLQQFQSGCNPNSYVTTGEKQIAQNGHLICEHMLLGTDCHCPSKETELILDRNLADSMSFLRINILILRDCGRILVKSRAFEGRKIYWLQFLENTQVDLQSDAFSGFSELEKLIVKGSYLPTVEPGAFSFETTVNEVSLVENVIGSFSGGAFLASRISNLLIDSGDISSIETGSFTRSAIGNLTITNSKISHIESKAFDSHSKSIHISNNKIGTIEPEAFDLPSLTLRNAFTHNGLFCHCSVDFIAKLISYNTVRTETLMCIAPRAFEHKSLQLAADFLPMLRKEKAVTCPGRSEVKSRPRKAGLVSSGSDTTTSTYNRRYDSINGATNNNRCSLVFCWFTLLVCVCIVRCLA